jgi:hypothetical protein
MKKLTLSLLLSLGLIGTTIAGQPMVSSGKEYKGTAPAPEYCFNDREFQLDLFGAYLDGNGHTHAGPIRESGYGGGIGINYFFSRHIGIGVDATWISAEENGAADAQRDDDDETIFHNISSSLIFRLPIDSACIAPYLFVGGGFHVDGDQWASAHAGLGIEYRIVPQRIGLFTDARFTYYGTRYGNDDQNNVLARAGIRFVF